MYVTMYVCMHVCMYTHAMWYYVPVSIQPIRITGAYLHVSVCICIDVRTHT